MFLIECAHKVRSWGIGKILKRFGVCVGYNCLRTKISVLLLICVSRDIESTIMLCLPVMCCEYKNDCVKINFSANHLATVL